MKLLTVLALLIPLSACASLKSFFNGLNQPAVAAFSPADISGMTAWYKADSLSLNDGDAIASWSDSSGNGNTLTQSTGANKPTYKTSILNGKPVVRWAGGHNALVAAGNVIDPTHSTTVYVVVKNTGGATTNGAMFSNNTSAADIFRFNNSSATTEHFRWRGPLVSSIDSNVAVGTWLYITFIETATTTVSGALSTSRVNGAGVTATGSGTRTAPDHVLVVGNDAAPGSDFFPFTGDLAELIIYSGTHNATQYGNVESYFKTKYGL